MENILKRIKEYYPVSEDSLNALKHCFSASGRAGLFKINIDADHNNLFSNDVCCQRTLEKTSAKTDEGWRRT